MKGLISKASAERKEACYQTVSERMMFPVGRLYVEKYFDYKSKVNVLKVIYFLDIT